ncbi:MAG: UPF0149 family protein [Rhodanobacteraceae bacterium]
MITYEEFGAAIAGAKIGIGAAELHGSVTGYLCARPPSGAHELLGALELESDTGAPVGPLHALVDEFAADIARRLRSGEEVTPLLPATPLQARADGVVEWCRGFLGGLGLTGALADAGLDPAARELLDAFAQIAAMRIECDGDAAALDGVLEFVRGGVLHLHAMLPDAGRP